MWVPETLIFDFTMALLGSETLWSRMSGLELVLHGEEAMSLPVLSSVLDSLLLVLLSFQLPLLRTVFVFAPPLGNITLRP